jgi:hypothetical protein
VVWKFATPRDEIEVGRIAEAEPTSELPATREQSERKTEEPFIANGIVFG